MESKITSVAEIERKWIMSNLPYFKYVAKREIWHYYLSDCRITGNYYSDGSSKFVKCIKTSLGKPGSNKEVEQEISREEFFKLTEGIRPLTKTRFEYSIDGKKWEVDMFEEINLILGEVEWIFPEGKDINMNEVNSYQVPEIMKSFIIAEVTHMPEFSNHSIFKNNHIAYNEFKEKFIKNESNN